MRMQRFRILKSYSSHYSKGNKENDKVHVCQDLELLPNKLRYLHWHIYPLRSMPSKFNPESLVELQMHHSNVKHLWKENQAIECLNQLVTLKLNHCKRLKNLPSNIHNLTSLRQLSLRGCSSITQFPEISGNVKFLYLDWTAIDEVPSSIEHLTKLYNLSLRNCTRLKGVSGSIFKLESLEYFYLRVLETREKLLYFDLDGTTIKELHASIELLPRLPNSICNMKSLSNLNLSGCSGVDKMLEDLPLSSSSGLCYLQYCLSFLEHLNPSGNNFESLSLKPFYSLKGLNISHCKRLQSLQEFPLPSRLQYLPAHQCISLKTLPTSNVVSTGNWNSQQSFIEIYGYMYVVLV
ncbi:hypothetical protein ACOSQ2_022129 [Xanthoceras sorbifolium]